MQADIIVAHNLSFDVDHEDRALPHREQAASARRTPKSAKSFDGRPQAPREIRLSRTSPKPIVTTPARRSRAPTTRSSTPKRVSRSSAVTCRTTSRDSRVRHARLAPRPMVRGTSSRSKKSSVGRFIRESAHPSHHRAEVAVERLEEQARLEVGDVGDGSATHASLSRAPSATCSASRTASGRARGFGSRAAN